ncbi:MAG: hypothetical protein RLZ55_1135, partial [Actinomycetota bacterium]
MAANYLSLFVLDDPQPLTRRGRIWGVVAVVLLAGVAAWMLAARPQAWPMLPSVVATVYFMLSMVAALTAIVLFGYARSSGQRGYLALGATYLYVFVITVIAPFTVANGLQSTTGSTRVLGGPQSEVYLYSFWHWGFTIGVIVSAIMLNRDQVTRRRLGLGLPAIIIAAAAVVVLVIASYLVAVVFEQQMPALIQGTRLTPLTLWLSYSLIALTLGGVVYLAWLVRRRGSMINRWLLAVLLVTLTEAIIVSRPQLNMVTFYGNRAFGLIAQSVLLVMFLWSLGRVGWAHHIVASVDSTSGAQSRPSFLAAASDGIQRTGVPGSHAGLLWVDLDGFKAVNDHLGHAVGDAVLHEVVRRIQDVVGPTSHVGRLGGDEFGVLLSDGATVHDDGVEHVAVRVLAAIRDPIVVGDLTVLVTASVGSAVCPRDADTVRGLLVQADLAMFSAKSAGGDRYQPFTPSLSNEAVGEARLRQDLSAALRARMFDIDYQPIVDVRTGQPRGAEALVRWIRDGERVSAGQFISFAERSGQILGIGHQVNAQLALDLPRIMAAGGPDFFVTFNLSVKQLADESVVHGILSGSLCSYPQRVIVEVTESLELHSVTTAARNLSLLVASGMPVAVDDFGAGFSNLAQLARLRPSIVKIDRSLVVRAGSGTDGDGVAMLQAAAGFARSLDCEVIAEGVETRSEQR